MCDAHNKGIWRLPKSLILGKYNKVTCLKFVNYLNLWLDYIYKAFFRQHLHHVQSYMNTFTATPIPHIPKSSSPENKIQNHMKLNTHTPTAPTNTDLLKPTSKQKKTDLRRWHNGIQAREEDRY